MAKTSCRRLRATWTLLALLLPLTGCQVRQPSAFETRAMTAIKHNITVGGGKEQNVLPASAENIHQGQQVFANYCFACHGLDGQKTGVPFADHMSPPIPSLNSPEVQRYTDGQLKWIIQNGISPSGMPAAKGILNDDEMWSIVLYLRHLPPEGSLGEPKAYSGAEETTQSVR